MATSAKKYLPANYQGVTAAHERVLLDISQQEAALISLLLGATPAVGPGSEVYDALHLALGIDIDDELRNRASEALRFNNTTNPHVQEYLGQYPGD